VADESNSEAIKLINTSMCYLLNENLPNVGSKQTEKRNKI